MEISQLSGIAVLFEAGNRFGELIADLQDLMPERELCLCRELTKTHQEIVRKRSQSLRRRMYWERSPWF